MQSRWTLLKWGSLGVAVGSVIVAALLLWSSPTGVVPDEAEQAESNHVEQPQTEVKKPLIVERKGDRLIWRLQAESAKQQERGMYLTEPRLEMFTETGEVIPIQGREAWFEPIRKNIRFKGAVIVDFREWKLKSEALSYDSAKDEVVVPGKFEMDKPKVILRGRGLRIERKTEEIHVKHDVWLEDKTGQAFGGGL